MALLSRISVVQQCRAEDLGRVRAAYDLAGIDAELSAFFPDVAEKLASAHLVIARAGASTVAELAVAGTAGDPGAAAWRDRRSSVGQCARTGRGTRRIGDRAAGFLPGALRDRLAALLAAPDMLDHAALAARSIARADAAARLADLVEELMRQEARA